MTSWPEGAPRPGDRAELSRRVEAADIELFTRISGDRNPLHYDEEAARASRFGDIIVQGGVTSAILNAVVAERLPGPGTVFLQVEWRFLAPVRPGDEITGAVEVLEVRQDKPITRLRTTVSRQDRRADGAQVSASGDGRPAWPALSAWALWLLSVLALAAVPLLDRLLRQAGRADLVQLTPGTAFPVVAMLSGATVGAVLASRRPRHPVGWLLLAVALSLTATGAAAQYLTWGLLVRPGALPAARWAALYYSAIGYTAMTSIGLLLLVTPTGSVPSPRWRWLARVMVATPVLLVVVATLTRGPLDPRHEALGGPFDLRGHGGVLLVANQVALAVTTLAVVVAAGSLVGRFRRARGVERLQLRWVALAALVVAMAGALVLAGLAVGVASASTLLSVAVGLCLATVPVATGAAVLHYRLYDLDRIISRTLAYGLLTLLLAGGYATVALGLGQLLGQDSSLVVAAATLAVAALFRPARRRVQSAVDRRFNRRRHDAGRIIEAFGARLRDQVDLDTLTAEVMGVVDQTMQPTTAWLWLRAGQAGSTPMPPGSLSSAPGRGSQG